MRGTRECISVRARTGTIHYHCLDHASLGHGDREATPLPTPLPACEGQATSGQIGRFTRDATGSMETQICAKLRSEGCGTPHKTGTGRCEEEKEGQGLL